RCRLQRLFVGHAELHEPAQLLHVQSIRSVNRIRADQQARAGPERLLRRYEIALYVVQQIPLSLGGEFVGVIGAVKIMLIVIDGGDVPDVFAHEFGDGRVVHVGRVFERIRAGADGVACAVGTVGMDRDLVAGRVRGVDNRLHFLIGDGRIARDVVASSCGAEDLHSIGTGIEHGLGLFGRLPRSIRYTGPSYDVV